MSAEICQVNIHSHDIKYWRIHINARYTEHASPRSVYKRSLRCDLAWPQFSSVSPEELELPLAYAMTVFSDARNIELSLATIFRPHNSYCLHIDPKSDHVFRCENISAID